MAALLIFLGLICIFYVSLFLGKYLARINSFSANIGKNIYDKKVDQYKTSSHFKPLRNAVNHHNLYKGLLIVFPLIIIKSLSMYFISLILIIPLVVVIHGITTGSLIVYHEKKEGNSNVLAKIIFWQLMSHLIAATFGFLKGLDWIFKTNLTSDSNISILGDIKFYIILSVVTGFIAAYLEVKSLYPNVKV